MGQRVPAETRRAALYDHAELGLTQAQVSSRHGVAESTAWGWLRAERQAVAAQVRDHGVQATAQQRGMSASTVWGIAQTVGVEDDPMKRLEQRVAHLERVLQPLLPGNAR